MSYQVLALKYRPRNFAEVLGQEHITKTLQNAFSLKRLHHAYLFTGVRGVGKTTIARILAKALNCQQPQGGEPCNECSSCREITAGSSMDVQEIDGASNTGVDDVRQIREQAKYLPSSSTYKIYIIDEVHMLSTSAFNALLKILEEPPLHVIFIFATTEPHKIPATVLSRCQRYDFRRIPISKIAHSLSLIAQNEKVKVTDEVLKLIAKEAQGSLRDAQSLFDQAVAFAGNALTVEVLKELLGFLDQKLLSDFLTALVNKESQPALRLLDQAYQAGVDLPRLSLEILELLRSLLVLKACPGENDWLNLLSSEKEGLQNLATSLSLEELQQMFNVWYAGTEQVTRSSFPKMLLEVLIIRLCQVQPIKPLAELLQRLEGVLELEPGVNKAPLVSAAGPKDNKPQNFKDLKPAPPALSPQSPASADLPPWEEFMRYLVTKRPQVASLFQHGQLKQLAPGLVDMVFESPLYSDMLMESDRKKQVEELFLDFFKRPMRLACRAEGRTSKPTVNPQEQRKKLTQEALESNLVKEAANVFGATVHDVKTEGE